MSKKNENSDIYGSEVYGGIPRQSSHCKIMVYSHITTRAVSADAKPGIIDCSRDVIQCEVSKTIKSGGGASFILVPRINYLNFIYPNDWVHIYFDPGDGRGFIRTFFGFVDRVDRSIQVDSNGRSNTQFSIKCSDFTKAFDKTNVYFNPHVADRGDFVSQFFMGTKQIAGVALRSKGIVIAGTPADIVMGLTQLMLGFGAQFQKPDSMPMSQALADTSRKQRLKNVMSRLSDEYQQLYGPEELQRVQDEVTAEYNALVKRAADDWSDPIPTNASLEQKLATAAGAVARGFSEALTGGLTSDNVRQLVLSKTALQYEQVTSADYQQATNYQNTVYKFKNTLLDLMDFSFVEYGAIDGSILSPQIWQSAGPVWSIMNSWSNDLVNELFCDLRFVGEDKKYDLSDGAYDHGADEIQGNEGGGVHTVPAMIMREYPFATVEGVLPPDTVEVLGNKLGSVPLGGVALDGKGSVFCQSPGTPGRRVMKIRTLNPFRLVESQGKEAGLKHLDVAAISVRDIMTENIGRGDADVVNLIEVYTDVGLGSHLKFMANTIQPIANPVSVARDGLRVRTYTTKFARWPRNRYKNLESGVDSYEVRYQTVRWALLLDHWYQHNREYLNGSITTRAFPEIRVGYRLDIVERNESYYVEGTNHSWRYADQGGLLTSAFTLSRGQRNDPFLVYVTPSLVNWGGPNNRDDKSRLAFCFDQLDPSAVMRASVAFGGRDTDNHEMKNMTDIPSDQNAWSKNEKGYLAPGSTAVSGQANQEEAKRRNRPVIDTSTAGMLEELGLGERAKMSGGKQQ